MTDDAPTLEGKVAALRDPATYPHPAAAIQTVETHMSWVFLAGDRVYKLKKPVCSADQDFSSPGRRRFYCREEVRLNRRLAPLVYLGVVPLVWDRNEALRLDAPGRAVDWLVCMRRLPDDDLMDHRLARRDIGDEDLDRVARRLAAFHRAQPRAQSDPIAYRAHLWRLVHEGEQRLLVATSPLPPRRVGVLLAGLHAWLGERRALLDARVQAGRVVEGHGDLRAEHVWLGEPLAIIDCLEFSRALRCVDAMDDVGLLALECERAGMPEAGSTLLAQYARHARDPAPGALLHFYRALRAFIRAGLAAAHLRESRYRGEAHWARAARGYFALAVRHLRLARAATPLPRAAAAGTADVDHAELLCHAV